MKFKCSCDFHILELNAEPFKGDDYIEIIIYNHISMKTGKLYKKPREQGTIVLFGEEARKFKKEIANENP